MVAALVIIDSPHPSAVVAGHKRAGADGSPDDIDQIRRFVQDFDAAEQRRATPASCTRR